MNMNEERAGKCLREVEHICGHFLRRYSITVNQVMEATKQISKWWHKLWNIVSTERYILHMQVLLECFPQKASALRRSHPQEGVPYRVCLEPYTFSIKISNDSIKKNNHIYSYDKRDDFNFPIVNFHEYEWGKGWEVFATSGTYPWSFFTQIFHNGEPSHGGDRKTFEVMTQALEYCINAGISYLPGAPEFIPGF
jgi:hypothetical protein